MSQHASEFLFSLSGAKKADGRFGATHVAEKVFLVFEALALVYVPQAQSATRRASANLCSLVSVCRKRFRVFGVFRGLIRVWRLASRISYPGRLVGISLRQGYGTTGARPTFRVFGVFRGSSFSRPVGPPALFATNPCSSAGESVVRNGFAFFALFAVEEVRI